MTAAQRTAFSKRRKQIWEALHPEIQVAQHEPPEFKQTGYKQPPPQTQGFAAATAESTGQSKATTNRAIARADALGDEALAKVVNTSLARWFFASERDENDQRKSPTKSEMVALAEAIAERLAARHGGDRKSDQSGNISTLNDQGKTRDIAAAKAGLGSGKTLQAAQAVIANGT